MLPASEQRKLLPRALPGAKITRGNDQKYFFKLLKKTDHLAKSLKQIPTCLTPDGSAHYGAGEASGLDLSTT
jgi:hypothetical protein